MNGVCSSGPRRCAVNHDLSKGLRSFDWAFWICWGSPGQSANHQSKSYPIIITPQGDRLCIIPWSPVLLRFDRILLLDDLVDDHLSDTHKIFFDNAIIRNAQPTTNRKLDHLNEDTDSHLNSTTNDHLSLRLKSTIFINKPHIITASNSHENYEARSTKRKQGVTRAGSQSGGWKNRSLGSEPTFDYTSFYRSIISAQATREILLFQRKEPLTYL